MRKLVLLDNCKLVSGEAGKSPLGRAKTALLSECSRAVALETWSGVGATLKARDEGVSQKLVMMTIDTDGTDAAHDEAILRDGKPVGYVSSGGYAQHVGRSMAIGYVAAQRAAPGTTLQVEILGNFYDAKVLTGPIYDANGANMRA